MKAKFAVTLSLFLVGCGLIEPRYKRQNEQDPYCGGEPTGTNGSSAACCADNGGKANQCGTGKALYDRHGHLICADGTVVTTCLEASALNGAAD